MNIEALFMQIETLFTHIDLYILIPFGMLMTLFGLGNAWNDRRKNKIAIQEIWVVFQSIKTGEKKRLKGSLLRKDCTRSEVFGLINMNTKSGERISIAAMKQGAYFMSLKSIQQDASERAVVLPLSEKELAWFPFSDFESWQQP